MNDITDHYLGHDLGKCVLCLMERTQTDQAALLCGLIMFKHTPLIKKIMYTEAVHQKLRNNSQFVVTVLTW